MYSEDGFVPTGLGDGLRISFKNTETNENFGEKDDISNENENENKNTVLKDWKYWDDLPDKYRKLKTRHNRSRDRVRYVVSFLDLLITIIILKTCYLVSFIHNYVFPGKQNGENNENIYSH